MWVSSHKRYIHMCDYVFMPLYNWSSQIRWEDLLLLPPMPYKMVTYIRHFCDLITHFITFPYIILIKHSLSIKNLPNPSFFHPWFFAHSSSRWVDCFTLYWSLVPLYISSSFRRNRDLSRSNQVLALFSLGTTSCSPNTLLCSPSKVPDFAVGAVWPDPFAEQGARSPSKAVSSPSIVFVRRA